MDKITIALIQLAWAGDRSAMKRQIEELVFSAAKEGADLVCLPEFSLSPYFASTKDPEGFDWAEQLQGGESERFFNELAHNHHVIVAGSIFEKADDDRYFDTATIHTPTSDELVYKMRKIHIPSGEGYHETSFFEGWNDYPVADLGYIRMSSPTCYDQWFPEVARICTLNGAEFVHYPTAIGSEPTSPDFDSQDAWQTVMRGHAIANGIFIGATNRIGEENGIRFYGSSFVCDPGGNILASAGRDTTEVVLAELDPDVQMQWRQLFPLLHQRKPSVYSPILNTVKHAPPDRWKDHAAFQDNDSSVFNNSDAN